MEAIRVRKLSHANLHVQCDWGQAEEIKEFFSFYVPGYKFMPAYRRRIWDGKIRLFDSQRGELPAGLIHHLVKFIESRGYNYELLDEGKYGHPMHGERPDPKQVAQFIKSINLPFEPRDYQFIAVMEALPRTRGILLSPTGSGKSLIIYILAKYWLHLLTHGARYPHAGRVLVIVPTTSLVEQMYNDFIQYGCGPDAIHRIYSGKDKNFESAICISTWQSIYKLPKDWYDQFGMVIGDECHGFKSKSLMNIMNKATEAKYRYGTTGTLDGTQTHELVLQGLFGKTFKVTTTKNLQDKGTLADLRITRLILDHQEEHRRECEQKSYQDEIEFIVTLEKRNRLIQNLALDLKGNTLVLYNFVEKHGKPLFEMIRDKAAEGRRVFFVSGGVATSDREAIRGIVEKQKNAIIVASLGTFSTGINIRNLHNIIFASPSKSQIRVLQSIGRGLRKSDNGEPTALYDLIDNISTENKKNFAWLHGQERLRIYKKEQFKYSTHKVDL